MSAGVEQRHGRGCARRGRCQCPWRAFVYSKRDGKKIRRTFSTKAAAVGWRDDARGAVRRKEMRAPTTTTLEQAAGEWFEGARQGVIRNRSGDVYKPSAIRGYEQGRREPNWKGAIVLTRALGVTVEEFADCISDEDVSEAEAPKRGGKGARAQPEAPPGRRSPRAGGAK